MDNIFTTTYDTYLVVIENWTAATTTDVPHMNVRIGGANGTAGYFGGTRILDYSGTLTNRLNFGNTQWDVAPQTPGLSGAFWFNRVGNTSEVPVFHGTLMDRANGYSMFISGFYNATSNVDGLRFKSSSSNVSGEIAVYGLAK